MTNFRSYALITNQTLDTLASNRNAMFEVVAKTTLDLTWRLRAIVIDEGGETATYKFSTEVSSHEDGVMVIARATKV